MSSKTLSSQAHFFGKILAGFFLFAIITSIVITSGCAGVTSASKSGPPPALAVTVSSLPAGTMQSSYSTSLTATGGTKPYSWSLLSGQLPPGLSLNSSSGAISGMPTQVGTFSFSAEVSDGETPAQTASASLSITIGDQKTPMAISVTALPNGETGTSYTATLTATGGTTPYSWTLISGTLPAGLGLSSSGVITGTPTQSGDSSFTVKVSDSSSPVQTATKALSITIFVQGGPLQITTVSFPSGQVSKSYSNAATAIGGVSPYKWSVRSGSLPTGLTLNASSGLISGTPTTAQTASFTIEAMDSESTPQSATKSLSITIDAAAQPPTVTTTSLASGTVGSAYSATLTATGGATPYSWSITSGSLPAGLALNSSTGTISGTPTTSGTATFTAQVKDANSNTGSKSLSITIAAAAQPPTVTTTSLASGTVGTAYSATLEASGGTTPYTWSITSGALPAGLSLTASSGAISGTPTTSGTASFTVQVKDANNNTGTQSLSITIAAAAQSPTVTTSSLPNASVGASYSSTLTASGGTTPYTWSVSSGSLPGGLSLTASTGTISGAPTSSGSWSFTVQVMDAKSNKGHKGLGLTVGASALSITTTSVPGGQVSSSYSAFLVASGGTTPYTWSITSGSLPTGLSLSSAGQISGTPTATGTSSFTVQVMDSSSPAQSSTKSLSITISTASVTPVQITTTSLPDAEEGSVYSTSLSASGGTTPYTWSISSGSLPAGLSLNASSGQISGTPTAEGAFSITAKVTDSSSPVQTATEPLSLTVNSSTSGNCPTGQPCGATATYCENYTPPSTSGATLISSLPYKITSSGNYYLDSDLSSTGIGIAVLANNVDINLNGHTITYGTTANGSGASAIGEYGILACNSGNLNGENLDSSYGSNGYCMSGGLSAKNVTVENGTIVQSTNASQYYDPNNCPGSGVGSGPGGSCAHHHETVASDAINMQYTSGITIRHLTLTWQNVDSNGVNLQYHASGTGDTVECNTFNDKVTQINDRAYPMGMEVIAGGMAGGSNPDTIQYNTMVGSPQMAIADQEPGTLIQYNDIDQGYYQAPPFTTFLHAYSNDYAIGSYACAKGGSIAYNYIHSVNGRGIGCIYQADLDGINIFGNYVSNQEMETNAEYGPNGQTNGASWPNPSGCEIDGGRAFETKGSIGMNVYNNTLIVNVSQCGGVGVAFTEFPCQEITCPATASAPFDIHDNNIQINNTTGSSTLFTPNDVACYSYDQVEGNYGNYFQPFVRESCTSDGDFVNSDPYSGGNYQAWYSATWTKGSHPLSSGCGNTPSRTCGNLMHWEGQGGGDPPNELGYVFQDVTASNGASISFSGEGADSGVTLNARGATVQWTYTPTVLSSLTGSPITGATVTATDSGGNQTTCQTNASGQCSLEIRQETVSSPAGSSNLTTTNLTPTSLTFSASGCTSLNINLSILGITADSHTLVCQ